MKRSISSSRILFLASCGLAAFLAGGALAEDAPSPSPAKKGPGAKAASKDEPAPAEMVLCRSPRGAVFARDAKVGCKFGARLDPSNLVDFGGGDGASACSLHPVGSAAAGDCDALCRSNAPGSSCVVAVGRAADGSWTSFGRDTRVADLVAAGGRVVCCRSPAPVAK